MALNPRTRTRLLLLALGLLGLAAVVLWQSGCAAGTDANGRIVIGVPVGLDPDSEGAELKAAGGVIGGLIGGPGGAAAGTAIAGVLATVLGGFGIAGSRARRSAEVRAAELTGAERGWIEREQAAGVQAPLVGGLVGGGGGVARSPVPIAQVAETPEVNQ